MNVVWLPEAIDTLTEITGFIDEMNTEGAGERWLLGFEQFVLSYARPGVQYSLCNYLLFSIQGLSCVNYFGWVVAFTIEEGLFIVHRIIRGALLG